MQIAFKAETNKCIICERTCQRKYSAKIIWRGADHNMLRKVVRSMNLWASTDIRLTTSPTVDERLAAFVMTSACRPMMGRKKQLCSTPWLILSCEAYCISSRIKWAIWGRICKCAWYRHNQKTKIWEFCADLPVDGSYDSRAYIHAGDETVLKVTVEDESLQEGCEEHEKGQRVTPPVRSTLLFSEGDQHPVSMTKGNNSLSLNKQHWTNLKTAVVRQ